MVLKALPKKLAKAVTSFSRKKTYLQKSNSSVNRAVGNCWDSNSNVTNIAQDELFKNKNCCPNILQLKKKKKDFHNMIF